MEQIRRYEILYTETAVQDIEEKADYIAVQFHDPDLAESWYLRLKEDLQKQLSTFPLKYPLYDVEPWNQRGIREYISRNDVVLYSVDEKTGRVYIRAVCTKGRDLAAHLKDQE